MATQIKVVKMNSLAVRETYNREPYRPNQKSVLFEYQPLIEEEVFALNGLYKELEKANKSHNKFERISCLRKLAKALDIAAAKLRCEARREVIDCS
jgi:hypothetical protein